MNPAAFSFLNALGQGFGGFAQDQQRRSLEDDKDEARQAAAAKQKETAEAKAREDALKGIRYGTAPDQGPLTSAMSAAGSFAGLGGVGVRGNMQAEPEQYAPDRFQQITPNAYLDRANTPDALAQKKQEIAARLQATRDAQREAFQTTQQQSHETFLAKQAQTAQAAIERRAQEAAERLANKPQLIQTGTDDTGKPVFSEYIPGTHTVHAIESNGVTPKGKAGAPGSAQSAMALQRLGMSAGDVESAISRMEAKENDPTFLAKLTAAQQAMGSASQVVPDDHAHGAMGVLNNAAGSFMSSAARSHMDPDVQEYMRDGQLTGLAFTEALPRPNQALLGMEKGLSVLGAGGATDAIRKDVQGRRRMGLQQLHNALGVLQGGTSVGHPNTAPLPSSVQPQQGNAPPGNVNLGGALAPLSVTDRARANSDPAFKAWLTSKGYTF